MRKRCSLLCNKAFFLPSFRDTIIKRIWGEVKRLHMRAIKDLSASGLLLLILLDFSKETRKVYTFDYKSNKIYFDLNFPNVSLISFLVKSAKIIKYLINSNNTQTNKDLGCRVVILQRMRFFELIRFNYLLNHYKPFNNFATPPYITISKYQDLRNRSSCHAWDNPASGTRPHRIVTYLRIPREVPGTHDNEKRNFILNLWKNIDWYRLHVTLR